MGKQELIIIRSRKEPNSLNSIGKTQSCKINGVNNIKTFPSQNQWQVKLEVVIHLKFLQDLSNICKVLWSKILK